LRLVLYCISLNKMLWVEDALLAPFTTFSIPHKVHITSWSNLTCTFVFFREISTSLWMLMRP
jgi:hypothetical protein